MFGRSSQSAAPAVHDEHGGGCAAAVTILPGRPLPMGLSPVAAAPAGLPEPDEQVLEPALVGGAPVEEDAELSPMAPPAGSPAAMAPPAGPPAAMAPLPGPPAAMAPPAGPPAAMAPPVAEAHLLTEVHVQPVTDEFAGDAAHTAEFADLMEPTGAPLPPAYAPDSPLPPPPPAAPAPAPVAPSSRVSFLDRLRFLRPVAAPAAAHEEDPFAAAWNGSAAAPAAAPAPVAPSLPPAPSYPAVPPPPPYVPGAVEPTPVTGLPAPAAPAPSVQVPPAHAPVAQAPSAPAPSVPAPSVQEPLPQFGQLLPPQVTPQDAFPAAPTVGLVFADGSQAELPDGPEGAALQHVASVLGDRPARREAEPGTAPNE